MSAAPPALPSTLERHALGTLQFIRSSIEAASGLAVPGSAGIAMGSIGTLAATLSAIPSLHVYRLYLWLTAAALALCAGALIIVRQARRTNLALYKAPLRKFLVSLCPALTAGALLTVILSQAGLDRLLAGTWLLMYGAAVLSASVMTSSIAARLVAKMGMLFMLLGTATFFLPVHVHDLLLGIGFGGLHVVFGGLIAEASRGK